MKINQVSLTLLIIILSVYKSSGQTDRGNFLIGGQTNLSFLSYTSSWKTGNTSGIYDKTRHFEIAPQMGYFISENLLVDIMLPISIEKKIVDNDYSKSSVLEFIPLVQRYFGNSKVRPFILGAVGVGYGHYTIHETLMLPVTSKYKFKSFIWEAGGGAAFFFTKQVSLDLSLLYFYRSKAMKSITPPSFYLDQKDIDKGLSSGIGIYLYFW
ncbi:MAG: outer membrane beta-barrel protein [Bacteroidales bacterium]